MIRIDLIYKHLIMQKCIPIHCSMCSKNTRIFICAVCTQFFNDLGWECCVRTLPQAYFQKPCYPQAQEFTWLQDYQAGLGSLLLACWQRTDPLTIGCMSSTPEDTVEFFPEEEEEVSSSSSATTPVEPELLPQYQQP